MKINIIGPSASGKTTLAKKLSKKHKIAHYDLDDIFSKHDPITNKRINSEEKEWRSGIAEILKQEHWIIEGVNPVLEIFEAADKIIFLNPPIHISFLRQWKRYFTEEKQRKEYGFRNNLKLSSYIFKFYFQNEDPIRSDDPKHIRLKKIKRILKKYEHKVEKN